MTLTKVKACLKAQRVLIEVISSTKESGDNQLFLSRKPTLIDCKLKGFTLLVTAKTKTKTLINLLKYYFFEGCSNKCCLYRSLLQKIT